MTNVQYPMSNDCLPSANYQITSAQGGHHNWLLVIGHWSLLLALLCFAQPALAMGSAPSKPEPKYKVEILKMKIVSQPTTLEVKKSQKGAPKPLK
jgi:hypothetical protein